MARQARNAPVRRSLGEGGTASSPKAPSDVLDHATSEIASGSKLGIDATKRIPGEGFKRPWPPLIKMDKAVKAKEETMLNQITASAGGSSVAFRQGHLWWLSWSF